MKSSYLKPILLAAVGYYFLARLALFFALPSGASPLWPAAGFATIMMIRFGYRVGFGLLVGSLAASYMNYWESQFVLTGGLHLKSVGIAGANLLEAFLITYFYNKQIHASPYGSARNFWHFFIVVFLGCLPTAVLGALTLVGIHGIPWMAMPSIMITWWVGDLIGILLFGGFVYSALMTRRKVCTKEWLEFSLLVFVVTVLLMVLFSDSLGGSSLSAMQYLLIPFLLWAIYRFQLCEQHLLLNLIVIFASWGTIRGHGNFSSAAGQGDLLLLQMFFLILYGMSITLYFSISTDVNTARSLKSTSKFTLHGGQFLYIIPTLTLVCGLFIISFIHKDIIKSDQHNLEIKTRESLQLIKHQIEDQLNEHLSAFERFSNELASRQGVQEDVWKERAKELYKDFPSYQAVEWATSDYRISRIVPYETNEAAMGLDIRLNRFREQRLNKAIDTKQIDYSDPINLIQGGRGIVVYKPLFWDDQFQGFSIVVFHITRFFDPLLKSVSNDFLVTMEYKKKEEYSQKGVGVIGQTADVRLSLLGQSWRLTATPRMSLVQSNQSPYISYLWFGGITMTILLALSAYFSGLANINAKRVGLVNETLETMNLELDNARIQAQQSLKSKSRFLANMSHEIRTPMNGVLGAVSLVQESELDEEQSELCDIINTSANALMVILNDILDFSKMESGKMVLHPKILNIKEHLKQNFLLMNGGAQRKGLKCNFSFSSEVGELFMFDPTRLSQVVVNLLSNAIKFTSEGHVNLKVTVENDSEGEGNGLLIITVSDSGVGLSKSDQVKIFEEFEQGEGSEAGLAEGTGLGLTISKKIVELMSGAIECKSILGQGTDFIVTLSLPRGDLDEIHQEAEKTPDRFNKRVLLCEDNKQNQLIIGRIISNLGCDIEVASDGEEAYQKMESGTYDLILMDLQMPKMGGLEATQKFLAAHSHFTTPIVALTANVFNEDRQKCREAGMSGFIAKPIRKNELKQELDKWLQT